MYLSTIISYAVAALGLFSTVSTFAIPAATTTELIKRADNSLENLVPFPFSDSESHHIESAFDAIMKIPEAVLSGGEDAFRAWIKTELASSGDDKRWLLAVAKCAATILVTVASEMPLGQVLRVRKYIEAIGGATKAAKYLLKCRKWADLVVIGGPNLLKLAQELTGFSSILNACFGFH